MNQDISLSRDQRLQAEARLIEATRAAQTASNLLDHSFAEFLGINPTDGRCLDIVDHRERVTAGELAKEAGLTTGAVTAVIDRLELAGLTLRRFDPSDRRKVIVELTPEAKRLSSEVFGPIEQIVRRYVEGLSDSEVLTIIQFAEVSQRASSEHAAAIRQRTVDKAVPLRYRLEQARMLKNDAKALFKTVKSQVKGMATFSVVLSGSEWAQDENGRWVKRSG
jgi:DNA-binding MarR family transcriptional regulator